jgi:hypothetical protein
MEDRARSAHGAHKQDWGCFLDFADRVFKKYSMNVQG